MGVIESISAGYRLLSRRVELLLAPILLDLLLWLGPRLSVAPLLRRVAQFYNDVAAMDEMPSDMAEMSRQVSETLVVAGDQSNLLIGLVNSALLKVPSLIAMITSLGRGTVYEIDNVVVALLLFGAFGLLGLLIGVVYLNMMARALPIGGHPRPLEPMASAKLILRHWGMMLLYIVLWIVLLVAALIPALLMTSLLSLISPALGLLFGTLLAGGLSVIFFYLYFVSAGVIVDNLPIHRAIAQSFALVRRNFWSTLGFVVLHYIIVHGIALLMAQLADANQAGMFVAILVNAYIGSGLAMAFLVFYRSRLVKQEELARSIGAP